MLLTPSFFVYFFNDKSESNINEESNAAHKILTVNPATEKCHSKLSQPNKGQKSLYETYPELAACETNFVKRNLFAAERRRTSTAAGNGVTLEEIQNHIYEKIPELRERGISKSTIHNMFVPTNKRNKNAECYKSLIDAKVPKKKTVIEKIMLTRIFYLPKFQ